MILAGGSEVGAKRYVEKLRKMIGRYPVEIIESPSFKEITSLYGKAKIFWSASGYGIKEKEDPKKVEHFGISVVEAMAAKAVPVVYSAGGHKEIVTDRKNGILWSSTRQLVVRTIKLADDKKMLKALSLKAHTDSRKYSYGRFEKKIVEIL
jgi:glycosyltransferase involved in cell wall biosynthesis